ncbi:MAG: FAD-dependent oxidoreductase [Planctomycetes bacterium]|nr:FAD-dependent oxidoreductase [Planctomycetota bacterium]
MKRYHVEVPTPEYWQRQIKCQDACPVHTDARGYVRAIAEGRFEDAYLIARAPNPLASICGRVCAAPCEAACRRGDVDESVSIRALKRFVTDRFGGHAQEEKQSPLKLIPRLIAQATNRVCQGSEDLAGFERFLTDQQLPNNAHGEKVAIIGSGPAGLSAAHDLALLGFRPTIFEMEPVPAGMLAVGIPQYRLPRDLITAEVEFIRALGVKFICNTQVGRDVLLSKIRAEHRATIIAVGLKRSRSLPIPGSDGPGVLGGIELLRDVALGHETDLQGDVVVIGGGNVAYDVARTVVRQTGVDVSRTALRNADVKTVHLCSLESLDELPADDLEILQGDEEGIVRHHSLGPKEILRDETGRVTGMVFQRCVRVFDESGRFDPEFDGSDLTTIPTDRVIWSIGQRPDLSFLEEAGDVEMTERGLPVYDAERMRTTADDIFLAGDIAYGPRMLIDAVASGKQVARKVYEFLRDRRLVENVQLVHLEIPGYSREADYEKLPRTKVPVLPSAERTQDPLAIVEVGYGESQAVCEGCRCLDCGVNTIFDSDKCILCGGCADVCPELCLELVSLDRLQGDAVFERVLQERTAEEYGDVFSAIIKDETKCIRCALCAVRCPVGAITMERVGFISRWDVSETTGSESA